MWTQLLVDPYLRTLDAISPVGPTGTRAVLVWDNVSFHKCADVKRAFADIRVVVRDLPPNATQLLQPMDLVINAPIKRAMRAARVNGMYDYLQVFRVRYEAAVAKKTALPKWLPPPPSLGIGIATMLDAIEVSLSTPKARANLARCFRDVGLALSDDGVYLNFASVQSVTIRVAHVQRVAAGPAVPADNVLLMDLLGDIIEEDDEGTGGDAEGGVVSE